MFKSNVFKKIDMKTLANCRKKVDVSDIEERDARHLQAMLIALSKYPRIRGMIDTRTTAVKAYDWRLYSNLEIDTSEARNRLEDHINLIINQAKEKLFGSMLFKITRNDKNTKIGENANIKIERVPQTSYEKVTETTFYIWEGNEGEETKRLIDMSLEENKLQYLYMIDGDGEDIGGIMSANAESIVHLSGIVPKWNLLNNKMQGVVIGQTDGRMLSEGAMALSYTPEKTIELINQYNNVMNSIGSEDNQNNVLTTLKGIDISLAHIVNASAAASYAQFKAELQADIAISLLGQANTMELPNNGGSRAALKELNLVRQDIMFSDIQDLTIIINKFLELEYRHTKGTWEVPYKFEFILDDVVDTYENAQTLQAITTLGVPIEISEADLYAKLGIKKPSPEDTIIKLGGGAFGGLMNIQNPSLEPVKEVAETEE